MTLDLEQKLQKRLDEAVKTRETQQVREIGHQILKRCLLTTTLLVILFVFFCVFCDFEAN